MTRRRTLAIGLDGYEPSIGEALLAAGCMPNLARLRERSARFELDHGKAKLTGLAWEHVSLGRSPHAQSRFAAVHFDPQSYAVVQRGSVAPPLYAGLDLRALIFDAPYFDLSRARNCQGLVAWGAHDAGTARISTPASLAEEIDARFGSYPATPYIYGFVWPDPAQTRAMGDALVRAVELRSAIGCWLLAERLREWDLALLVVSELHSALEALWHGVDPRHPLHALPSAGPARDGVHGVYAAVDRLVGALGESAPDANLVLFSMHGMGANNSDLPSMLLLPELLYRVRHGRARFVPRPDWAAAPDGMPLLGPRETWSQAVLGCIAWDDAPQSSWYGRASQAWRRREPPPQRRSHRAPLAWMPAAHYQPFWSGMDAFALPSYYDGRIRLNLIGRERQGRVALRDYASRCDELVRLLGDCRDPRTGDAVVAEIERPVEGDPLAAAETAADLTIRWRGAPLAFSHPRLGEIGPAPYRRTGGHTGGNGVAYLALPDALPGDYGLRSAFDVVPTLLELCGTMADGISGESLLPACRAPRRERGEPISAGGFR